MTDLSGFFPLFGRSEAAIMDEMAARANDGLATDDPDYVDTRPGSFYYLAQRPVAIGLATAYSRMNEAVAAGIVATSWGPWLDLHAESFGTERKAAVAAEGIVTFVGAVDTLIGTGVRVVTTQTDPDIDPVVFETTQSGIVPDIGVPTGLAGAAVVGGSLAATTTYHYVATGVDVFGGETLPTADVAITTSSPNKKIHFNVVFGANTNSVRIYRRTAAAGPPWDFVFETTLDVFDDDGTTAPDGARHPPTVATTQPSLGLTVQALEPGAAGNVAAAAVTLLDTGVSGIQSVTNLEAFAGGVEEESDKALKIRLVQRFEGQGPGNQADYVRWALDEPGVGRVTVIPNAFGLGTVQVIIMDENGRNVDPVIVTRLQNRLDPVPGLGEGQAPIDHEVTVETPDPQEIYGAATVTFKSGYSLDGGSGTIACRALILASIDSYINGLNAGEDVILNHLRARFFEVTGVLDVTALTQAIYPASLTAANIAITTTPPQVAIRDAHDFTLT